MKYIELSHCLKNNFPIYPGDPEFKLNLKNKEDYYISKIEANFHTGTHIDSPKHYYKDKDSVNQIRLETLIGNATILNLKDEIRNNLKLENREIKINDIKNINDLKTQTNNIVILNTSYHNYINSKKYFYNNPYLSIEFTKYLIENNIKTIAIDTCSVDKYENSKIHKLLLKNNISIIENLTNTNMLTKSQYKTYFIPINIKSEASFVRAFVEDNE